mmetsp:Transcript_44462/g.54441  ORF Transcript_44462/g.54441 Transcript_44462/m.54441 type:complete len:213 (+) Transcript_44462:157-795(+)
MGLLSNFFAPLWEQQPCKIFVYVLWLIAGLAGIGVSIMHEDFCGYGLLSTAILTLPTTICISNRYSGYTPLISVLHIPFELLYIVYCFLRLIGLFGMIFNNKPEMLNNEYYLFFLEDIHRLDYENPLSFFCIFSIVLLGIKLISDSFDLIDIVVKKNIYVLRSEKVLEQLIHNSEVHPDTKTKQWLYKAGQKYTQSVNEYGKVRNFNKYGNY